ncbi:DUF350 domain-containing protein [Prosthecodimorpha staleyi]|uniref:DUF350 domain-containing protein n=1 Tax=Prosthecodimorpha staleyi TaxID=2840188 RepID=A0A947G9D0_9HYPH|nr:DUF350 domain-containing protein [Prosthecodimorpha staleyi]MBT9287823.1 DUF350 domain-containing protein [Prosthecodimorpha staleyi]
MDLSLLGDSLSGLVPFLIYVGLSLGMILVYVAVYTLATAHDELALIRADNVAAAVAFGGSMLGFALPLASAAMHTRALAEFLLWGAIAIVVQVLVYYFFRLIMLRDVSRRIEQGQLAAGLLLGSASLTGGIVNAAAMAT